MKLMIAHLSLPLVIQQFGLFNPTKSGKFVAILADLTQLEKISKLLMNSCGGEIILPPTKLILVVGHLVHAEKIERKSSRKLREMEEKKNETKKKRKKEGKKSIT